MAYGEEFADRIREMIFERNGVTEKKMFGGVAWMVEGNMAVGTFDDGLLVRAARDDYESLLAEPHVRRMEMSGRVMHGFVVVDAAGVEDEADLASWIATGATYASSLPSK